MFGKCGYRIHQQFSSEVHYVNKYAVCPIDEYGTKVDAELKKEMELLRKAQEEAERLMIDADGLNSSKDRLCGPIADGHERSAKGRPKMNSMSF